jgi:hypothetical protein
MVEGVGAADQSRRNVLGWVAFSTANRRSRALLSHRHDADADSSGAAHSVQRTRRNRGRCRERWTLPGDATEAGFQAPVTRTRRS